MGDKMDDEMKSQKTLCEAFGVKKERAQELHNNLIGRIKNGESIHGIIKNLFKTYSRKEAILAIFDIGFTVGVNSVQTVQMINRLETGNINKELGRSA